MSRFLCIPSIALPIVAACLLSSCGDKTSNSTVVMETDETPLFGQDSGQTHRSSWNLPEVSLNQHIESRSTAWTVQSSTIANARPGGLDQGQLFSGLSASSATGFSGTERQTGGADPAVRLVQENFLATSAVERQIRLATDGDLHSSYYTTTRLFLPNTIEVGTAWIWDLDNTPVVGLAFAQLPVGAVTWRPTIRTTTTAFPPEADPNTDTTVTAVDNNGDPTSDSHAVAIDYTISNGYRGQWIDVQRRTTCTVTEVDVTTPDLNHQGCIKVILAHIYSPRTPVPAGYTMVGLEQFSGSYTLYWKPGIGWVHWSGAETIPQWGFAALTSPGSPGGVFPLTTYNASYDYGFHAPYATHVNTMYANAWTVGYQAGYRDVSPYPGSGSGRKSMIAALNDGLLSFGCSDADLLNSYDLAMARGKRACVEPAFQAGYALGAAYYDDDYVAAGDFFDTLAGGATDRSYRQLHQNRIPDALRSDGALFIPDFGIMNILAGRSPTGRDYANGYDGLGMQIDAFDPLVTVDPSLLRFAKDTNGQPLRHIYIALPTIGTVTTTTLQGAVTNSGLVTNNG